MTDSTQRPAPTTGKLLIFYGITFLLFFSFAELVLRLFEAEAILVDENHPQMVYSFHPERTGIAAGPEYRVEVKTDEWGMRACDGPVTEEPELNVYVFGDSFAEGWGVPCNDSFPELLNARPELRVYNGGLHGGSPSYYVLRNWHVRGIEISREIASQLDERGRGKATITFEDNGRNVIQIFDNDLDDIDKFERFVVREDRAELEKELTFKSSAGVQRGRPAPFAAFKNFASYRAVRRLYYGLSGNPLPIKYYKPGREPSAEPLTHAAAIAKFGGLEPLADPDGDYNGQFAFYKYRTLEALRQDELWAGRLDRMHAALTQLTALSRQTGDARMVLAYIPAKEVFASGGILGDGPERPLSVAELRARNPLYQYLAEFVAEYKDYIILVDGQQVLHADAEALYFPGDAHLNVKGHARFAEALAAALLSSR